MTAQWLLGFRVSDGLRALLQPREKVAKRYAKLRLFGRWAENFLCFYCASEWSEGNVVVGGHFGPLSRFRVGSSRSYSFVTSPTDEMHVCTVNLKRVPRFAVAVSILLDS